MNKDFTLEEKWDILVEYHIATEEELQLITDIEGYNEQAIDNVVYARCAYNTFEQWIEDLPYIDPFDDIRNY